MKFTLEAPIRGQGRPRFTAKGITYKDPRDRAYEAQIFWAYKAAGGKAKARTDEVAITITTWRKLPDSKPKRLESEPDTHKPDVDNVAKAVLDALNGIAWKDDAQVTELTVRKMPRTRRAKELLEVEIIYKGEANANE